MPIITYREAVNAAIDEEMQRDERVFLIGEEVAQYNGAYKVSRGLWDKYGDRRVIDTPITEEGFTGIGIGAAMAGLRPIVEWMTFNFSGQAFDQILNNVTKMRYMSGGQFTLPIVFRGPNGPAGWLSSQHSQALEAIYTHLPGLKVLSPTTPYDAKGLLKSAIRDDNPVVVMESELLYGDKGEVPSEEYLIPIGKADIKKAGKDLTIITYDKALKTVLQAHDELTEEGIDAEILDLRSLRPMDEEAVIKSVSKTNRCIIVSQAWPVSSVASYIGWFVSNRCFDLLDAPVELITAEDTPTPYNHDLELASLPSVEKIINTAKKILYSN